MRRLSLLILLLVPSVAHAEPDKVLHEALAVQSVGDLVRACREIPQVETLGAEDGRVGRMIACVGYIRGAMAVYAGYQEAHGIKTVCIAERASYRDVVVEFVDWADVNPDRHGDNAAQGFLTAMLHRFRC
jgi:hypothetical protein